MAILGLVGGIAPGSTVDYYRRIIERYQRNIDDGSYPSIVINSIDLTRMLRLIDAPVHDELVEFLSQEIERLSLAGVDFALLASNTPHLVFGQIAARSRIPLISIVESTAKVAELRGLSNLGLLGTRFTMEGGFYESVFGRHGLRVAIPGQRDREWVHDVYVNELIKGKNSAETRRRMFEVVANLNTSLGVDGVILGGTELPLLLGSENPTGVPLLDTTRIHVEAAVSELVRRDAERAAPC